MTYTVIFSKGDHRIERHVENALDVADILLKELPDYVWEFKDEQIEDQWLCLTHQRNKSKRRVGFKHSIDCDGIIVEDLEKAGPILVCLKCGEKFT
jgi:hypothetical protein